MTMLDSALEDELQSSYIDYAMSVIVGRAIPDARDGLKPVQRRILYTMHNLKNFHNEPTKKSARIVGDCIGRLHPHGDMAVYEALVRMAQDFSMNHMLVEGQGNFGCFTKDTKIRLTDGRDVGFEQLISEQGQGKRHWTFGFNTDTKEIEIQEIKNPRLTRKDAELVEVTLDNNEKIRCTPDHRFLLRNGAYAQARELRDGDSLMPVYTKLYDGSEDRNLKGYEMVLQPVKNEWQFTHRLSDEWNLRWGIYARSAGRVRHHIDMNKENNNPANIIRLDLGEHWRIHHELASWKHKNDAEYVRKLDEGRKKYIQENHNRISKRISEINKKNWKIPSYRDFHVNLPRNLWKDNAYKSRMAMQSSIRLKNLWKDKNFKEHMRIIKSKEMKARWKFNEYRRHMRAAMQQFSLKMWEDPAHRAKISRHMKQLASTPEWIKRQKEISRELWKRPEYRSRFTKEHFSKMGRQSWRDEKTRLMHKEKAHAQWQDQSFRAKMTEVIKQNDARRIQNNPRYMKDLSLLSQKTLHNKWKDPKYKQQVIKSKILNFASVITKKHAHLTPEVYESERRPNSGIPRAEHALEYFSSFEQIEEESRTYNHKVKNVVFLQYKEDTYDLTVEPWHNFALSAGVFVHNSVDGDPPAAQRYTEVRLRKIAEDILEDLEKETVQFIPNFDNTEKEPLVMPSKIPNLLVNGASGIAVGVATSIPPHNLGEVCDAITFVIEKKDATAEDILGIIKGPDFPTGGTALMSEMAYNGYRYGRGQVRVRAKAEIDEKKNAIIVSQIPYNTNKSAMIENIANLVKDKKIEGISDIRDESGKEGINILFVLKKGASGESVLNSLFRHTQLETTFPIINLAVVGNSLRTFNIVQLINTFINHRRDVVRKRSIYELNVAKDRMHIVEGLLITIDNINDIVKLIRQSNEVKDARAGLMKAYSLSEKQANAILDMKLSRLTHLEFDTLMKERKELESRIKFHEEVVSNDSRVDEIIKEETAEVKKNYAKGRNTVIVQSDESAEIEDEDTITNKKTTVILTNSGYIKRLDMENLKAQERGGKGMIMMNLKEGDYVKHMLTSNTKDYLLCISDKGRAYWLKVYKVPEGTRYAEGKAIVNLLSLKDERIVTLFSIENFENAKILFLTKNGIIKKVDARLFSNPRVTGIIAMGIAEKDSVVDAIKYVSEPYIIIASQNGKLIRFREEDLRMIGRTAIGVRGMKLKAGDEARCIIACGDKGFVATVTELGYGKLTDVGRYRLQNRGGSGVLNIKIGSKTGKVAKAVFVGDAGGREAVLISSKGIAITFPLGSIRITGRAARGVRVMRLDKDARVVDFKILSGAEAE